MRSLVPSVLLTLCALSACKHPDPAPADIDGLSHFFWDTYDTGTDEELNAALVNLDAAIQAQSLADKGDATAYQTETLPRLELTDLSKDEQAIVLPGDERDPSIARGMLVINPLPCTVEQVERFNYDLEQDVLYPNAYETYSRVYTSDFDSYIARTSPTLTWDVDLTSTTAGIHYQELLSGGIRYVPADSANPFGDFVVNRTWLTEPAIFDGDGNSFDQDFQLEVQYANPEGTVIHFYAIWRQASYFGLDQEDDSLMGIQADGLLDWDDETAALCEAEANG